VQKSRQNSGPPQALRGVWGALPPTKTEEEALKFSTCIPYPTVAAKPDLQVRRSSLAPRHHWVTSSKMKVARAAAPEPARGVSPLEERKKAANHRAHVKHPHMLALAQTSAASCASNCTMPSTHLCAAQPCAGTFHASECRPVREPDARVEDLAHTTMISGRSSWTFGDAGNCGRSGFTQRDGASHPLPSRLCRPCAVVQRVT
jgi:hypothetical protein